MEKSNIEYQSLDNEHNYLAKEKLLPPREQIELMLKQGLQEHAQAYFKVVELAQEIREQGGKGLLVGGSVRDFLMNKIPKDFDLEVYGLPASQVEEIAFKFGKIADVGKAFGILKMFLDNGLDIDISLPRTDSKIGEGHRGFEVKTDPQMTVKEAAKRRDFTINSVAADPLTGEIYDPFNGVEDIKNRVLRITDLERFKDDPLRVLRALQFIGRFGMEVEPTTQEVIRKMSPLLKELPKERIAEEWKKLLLKSPKPSLGLSAGMLLGVFQELHPEFPPLAETPQEAEWHPEGDVWIHTLMVVDKAAEIIRRENLSNDSALVILLASLCHDLGKPLVTEYKNGRIRSHGHEPAGKEPTQKFLKTLGLDNLTNDKVLKLVVNHLIPSMFYIEENVRGNKISDGAIRRLAKRLYPATIQELTLLGEADHLGRGPFADPEFPDQLLLPYGDYPAGEWLLTRARELAVEDSRPVDLTRGRDWLNFGFKQGKEIGKLIALSNDLRDEKNFSREMVFALVDGVSDPDKAIEILTKAVQT